MIRHSSTTRLLHAGLALTVTAQLLTSQVFVPPQSGPENVWFEVHEYSGLATFALAFLFWLNLAARRRGTPVGLLFPWFSAVRLAELRDDTAAHVKAATRLTLPPYRVDAALPSAVHGLGILLVAAMASLGAIWFGLSAVGAGETPLANLAIETHVLLGNLVWAYVVGHVALAILHSLKGAPALGACGRSGRERDRPTIEGGGGYRMFHVAQRCRPADCAGH